MPIFMDRHLVEGASQEAVAEAHLKDLEIQHQYNCKAITYWVDTKRGCAFCLIEAPSEVEVKQMHEKAHGLIPNEIIKVDSDLVQSFLGRIQDPEDADFQTYNGVELKVFSDSAFRVLVNIKSSHTTLLHNKLGKARTNEIFLLRNTIIRKNIAKYNGSEVEIDGQDFVISFKTAKNATQCLWDIQKELTKESEIIALRMGIHAGNPVDNSGILFGETIRFTRLLCDIANPNEIVLSATIKVLLESSKETIEKSANKVRILPPSEEHFLTLLCEALFNNWENPDFDISDFCSHVSVSKSQLYKKCIHTTGVSPNSLLRDFRLSQALQKLGKANQNISQTAFDVGFNNPSYFTKCFYKAYGITPSDFLAHQ